MNKAWVVMVAMLTCCMLTQVLAQNTVVTLEVTEGYVEVDPGGTGSGSSGSGNSDNTSSTDNIEKEKGNIIGGHTSDDKFIRTSSPDIEPNKTRIAQGYINGYPDKTFRPDKELTREEYAVILYRLLKFEPRELKDSFIDVTKDHWSYTEVNTLAAYELIVGIGNGKYEPLRSITVEEAVLIIDRVLDTSKYNKSSKIDIIGTTSGKAAINRCYNIGILSDIVDKNVIDGKREISRWEIVSILNKVVYRSSLSMKSNKFIDIDSSSKYYTDVVKATYTKIVYKQLSVIHKLAHCTSVRSLPVFIY